MKSSVKHSNWHNGISTANDNRREMFAYHELHSKASWLSSNEARQRIIQRAVADEEQNSLRKPSSLIIPPQPHRRLMNFETSSESEFPVTKKSHDVNDFTTEPFVERTNNVTEMIEKQANGLPSYTAMIAQSILCKESRKSTLGEIYDYMDKKFPSLEKRGTGWRNCVRHTLSLNDCFIKLHRPENGRSCNWAIHPTYYENFVNGDYRKRRMLRKKIRPLPGWNHHPSLSSIQQQNSNIQSNYYDEMNLYTAKSIPTPAIPSNHPWSYDIHPAMINTSRAITFPQAPHPGFNLRSPEVQTQEFRHPLYAKSIISSSSHSGVRQSSTSCPYPDYKCNCTGPKSPGTTCGYYGH